VNKILEYLRANKLLRQGLIDTNYYFLAQVGSRVIGFLVIPVFARLLSVEEFASYDLFILASSFIVLLAGLGMDSGATIKIAENKDNVTMLRGLLFASLSVNVIALLALWLLSMMLWWLYFTEEFNLFFVHGIFIYTLFYQFSYIVFNFMRWLGNARNAAFINFSSYLLGIGGGVIGVLFFHASINYYIIGATIGSLLGVAMSGFQARNYLAIQPLARDEFFDLMKLSLPYIPTYLSNYFMQFVDRLLITTFFGLPTLGLFALVNRIGQIVSFGLMVISSGFRPIVTSNYANEEGQGLSRKIFSIYCITTVPVCILTIVLSPFIIRIFGGEQYTEAIPVLPYIVLSVWFLGCFFLFGFGYQIKRKTVYVTAITLSVVVLMCGLSLVLIKYSGMMGIAQATAISAGVGALVYVIVSERLYSFNYPLRFMYLAIATSTAIVFLFA
jgi:O-antigen/teichoic acid export membrane protein